MRVANVRNKIDLQNISHVHTDKNIADTRTRPDLITAELLKPGSYWIDGKDQMRKTVQDAINMGTITSTAETKLHNDKKKKIHFMKLLKTITMVMLL